MILRPAPALNRVRNFKGKPIGSLQRKLLEVLIDHPGVDAARVMVLCEFPNLGKAELAIQGLVQRGLARWEPGNKAQNILYFVTKEGLKKLKNSP